MLIIRVCLLVLMVSASLRAQAEDWSGAYVGGQITRLKFDINDGAALSLDGIKGTSGLHAGYAQDFGRFVTAAELEYDRTVIDLDTLGELDNALRIRTLWGYDRGRYLPYAVIGYGWGDLRGGPVDTSEGPLFGIGVTYLMSPTISVGAELTKHWFNGEGGLDGDAENLSLRIAYRF